MRESQITPPMMTRSAALFHQIKERQRQKRAVTKDGQQRRTQVYNFQKKNPPVGMYLPWQENINSKEEDYSDTDKDKEKLWRKLQKVRSDRSLERKRGGQNKQTYMLEFKNCTNQNSLQTNQAKNSNQKPNERALAGIPAGSSADREMK